MPAKLTVLNRKRDKVAGWVYRLGLRALDRKWYRVVNVLGHWLINRRQYSGGWELIGSACIALRNYEVAIQCLLDGCQKFPEVTVLWSNLGHAYSDAGEYTFADSAYKRAGEDPDFLGLSLVNRAIIEYRRKNKSEGLRLLEEAKKVGGYAEWFYDEAMEWLQTLP